MNTSVNIRLRSGEELRLNDVDLKDFADMMTFMMNDSVKWVALDGTLFGEGKSYMICKDEIVYAGIAKEDEE